MFGWRSVAQAAKKLGGTRQTIWNWIEKGEAPRGPMVLISVMLAATLAFVSACSSSQNAVAPPASTSASLPFATIAVLGTDHTVALGTDNPAQGDCTTNTSEAASSVGSAVLNLTSNSFRAEIQLQSGSPNMTYGVFMQQVPGACPQPAANAGVLTTDSTGRGQASTAVSRAPGATAFYVQLVPGEVGAPTYTSDRISTGP